MSASSRPPSGGAAPGGAAPGGAAAGGPEGELFAAAAEARRHAHAPYSGFAVGAAVLSDDGRIFAGCNVENASYPEGTCAETGAIAAMVAAGADRIKATLVLAEGTAPVTPCGGCRQRLAEFAGPDTPVILAGPEGERARTTLGALLPSAFFSVKRRGGGASGDPD